MDHSTIYQLHLTTGNGSLTMLALRGPVQPQGHSNLGLVQQFFPKQLVMVNHHLKAHDRDHLMELSLVTTCDHAKFMIMIITCVGKPLNPQFLSVNQV